MMIMTRTMITIIASFFGSGFSGFHIVAGEHNLMYDEGSEQAVMVDRAFIHPQYDDSTVSNDIALIKLSSDIEYNDYVQPACLPVRNSLYGVTDCHPIIY